MMTRRNLAIGFAACAAPLALAFGAPTGALAQPEEAEDWPNVFISPFGQPFRAKDGAPYPVVDWFKQVDKNADGKIDKTEFLADAAAFFTALDVNGDGVLDNFEIQRYERKIAPEILGFRVKVAANGPGARLYGGQIWLAQMGGGPSSQGVMGALPSDAAPAAKSSKPTIDESRSGASPFGFFDAPEPVTAADLDFTGFIKKKNFLRLAGVHFQSLDRKELGYLTLDGLPRTHAQEILERARKRRR